MLFCTQNISQVRQNAVIFSDHEASHENVSPLLFGDFNDDILQLMKLEENHTGEGQQSVVGNACTDYYTMNDCGQLKSNHPAATPITSSQSDPGYASTHRTTTAPTESHGVSAFISYFSTILSLCKIPKLNGVDAYLCESFRIRFYRRLTFIRIMQKITMLGIAQSPS